MLTWKECFNIFLTIWKLLENMFYQIVLTFSIQKHRNLALVLDLFAHSLHKCLLLLLPRCSCTPSMLVLARNESILQIRGHHAVGCVRWTLAKLWCLLVSIWRAEPFRRGGRSAAQGPFTGTPHTCSSSCSTPSSGTLFTWTPLSGVAGHGGTPHSGTFLEHTAGLQ